MSDFTPADFAAVSGNNNHGMFGNEGIWLFAILALMWGGGGFFGGRGQPQDYAKQSDVVYTSAFNQLQNENTAIRSDIQRVGYDNMTTVKDVAYNNLSEIRDLEGAVNLGFANQQKCCCETLRAIDQVNYNAALNTASINANTVAQTQKILDLITSNKMAEMQNQINALQLQLALNGVVRYPSALTYDAGKSPFCGGGSSTTS